MANYVIEIDGQVVDLGSANITLTWKSNLFTDLSKITGNHSYTISLPKSQNNRMVFGIPEMPGFNSTKVRKFLPATIEMDGILIADNARAVLTGVSDKSYEVALTWGIGAAIQRIAEAGKTLQELTDNNESVAWDASSNLMAHGSYADYGFAHADYGFKNASKSSIYYHPCASAKWILSKIASQHSSALSLPSEFDMTLKNLYIPLVTRRDSELIAKANAVSRKPYSLYGAYPTDPGQLSMYESGSNNYSDSTDKGFYIVKVDSEVFVEFTNLQFTRSINTSITSYLQFRVDDGSGITDIGDIVENKGTGSALLFNGKYRVGDIKAGSKLYIYLMPDKNGVGLKTNLYPIPTITFSHAVGTIAYPWTQYPIIANLPEIKQIDFIKMVCAMYGYTVSTTAQGLSFVRISTVVNNAGHAYQDWSNYMISGSSKETHTFSDFAQRNWMRWKESDEGIEEDAAYITVNNNTLSIDKDLIKFPLSNSVGNVIPCYSFKDGALQYKACKPRIMRTYRRPDGTVGLRFDGLTAGELITNNYVAYSSLVLNPFTVKSSFRLPSYMLKNIDMYKPVYLSYYGYYFAIISITTGDKGISEVELLKI